MYSLCHAFRKWKVKNISKDKNLIMSLANINCYVTCIHIFHLRRVISWKNKYLFIYLFISDLNHIQSLKYHRHYLLNCYIYFLNSVYKYLKAFLSYISHIYIFYLFLSETYLNRVHIVVILMIYIIIFLLGTYK